MRWVAVAALALAGACALEVVGTVPARVTIGTTDPAAERSIEAARALADRGDGVAALRQLASIPSSDDLRVEAERLRQDILRQRGRLGLLRAEAEARVAAAPDSAGAHYLRGRVLPPGTEMQAAFQRAAELEPQSLWPWLGLAFALRRDDPEESLAIYARLYEASAAHPVVGVAYASGLRAEGRLRDAIAVYEQLAAGSGPPGVGHLGLAQSLFALGGGVDRVRGWAALLAAVRARPFDPGVHAVVRELVRLGIADEQVEEFVDVLRQSPQRLLDFGRGAGLEPLVAMLTRAQQPHAALAALAQGGVTSRQPPLRRLQRRLLLTVGDVAGFLQLLARDVPRSLLDDESNQVRARWCTLIEGPWSRGEPLADAGQSTGLVRALRDAGLLQEAEAVAEIARQRTSTVDAELLAVRDEVRAEIAFESALRRALYQGYANGAATDLETLLAQVRGLSQEILGRDVVGRDVRFTVPLVGEMLDPFAADLCLHLARYNRHLVLGRRAGGVPEALLLTRLSVRDLPEDAALPLPGRCREIVGVDRSVRSLSSVLGGDLAGVALLNHYVVDYDAVSEWAAAVAARRTVAHEDGNALLDDPVPAGTGPLDPMDVSWRLAAVSSIEDSALDAAVLEVIRLHERRHLVDSFHYLPLESNLWRGLGLLLRFGLSPAAIEAEMERRAELAALARASHRELVLAHVAEFLVEDDPESPHVQGFGQLARDYVDALVREGLEPAQAAVAHWHRLDPEVARRAADRLLRTLP